MTREKKVIAMRFAVASLVLLATAAVSASDGPAVMNREGRRIIVVKHDAEIAAHAPRVKRMKDGRLLETAIILQRLIEQQLSLLNQKRGKAAVQAQDCYKRIVEK